jgi:hypothetical protein
LFEKAISVPKIGHSIHWHLFLESNNEDNLMKDYFKEIYEELLVELEEVNLELYESI